MRFEERIRDCYCWVEQLEVMIEWDGNKETEDWA
jgi:hypothetical protein